MLHGGRGTLSCLGSQSGQWVCEWHIGQIVVQNDAEGKRRGCWVQMRQPLPDPAMNAFWSQLSLVHQVMSDVAVSRLRCWCLLHLSAYRTGPLPHPHVWFLLSCCVAEPAAGWIPAGTLSAPDMTVSSPESTQSTMLDVRSLQFNRCVRRLHINWHWERVCVSIPGHCEWPVTGSWWGSGRTRRHLGSSGTDLEQLPPHCLLPP